MLKVLPCRPNISQMTRHKFLLTIALTGFYLLLFSSCATENAAVEAPITEADNPKEGIESSPVTPPEPQVQEGPRKVVGAFRSVKGVMDPLSCYCSNGGYVESPAGESVPVCFDNNQNVSNTDYIFIEGVMTTRSIESNGACSEGTMSYLIVESYSLTP